ncbi:MAG: YqhA family protein [Gammaproteobacteria bacterium]|nr:YqhA family protein [Gammaproteobacteria bacterium]
MESKIKKIEKAFEYLLWNSRFVVLFAVISSALTSLIMFYMATVDAFYMITHFVGYASPELQAEARIAFRGETITHAVEIVDGYLLGTVLLIFALGLYELFISRIDIAERSETASNVLIIHSLDSLKTRLAKVILMILIVRFFESAIGLKFETALDLLYLAGGIGLIGLALYLTHDSEKPAPGNNH